MQDSSPSLTGHQADSQQLLERIDRLESLLRRRQQALGEQMNVLQSRLASFGLDTVEKIAQAYGQLEASHRETLQQQLQPAAATEHSLRATAYRRMGRMV